ncbi:MAG: alpha/beta fold hydrolase [Planctomycetota bacterium]
MQLDVGRGVRLEVEELGDPQGEPLLLIMGLGAQLLHWPTGLCELLAARGLRVIRFDNRDAGLSTPFQAQGTPDLPAAVWRMLVGLPVEAPYDLSDMARDALGVLDGLGIERAHVVGASMGGMIAQTVALQAPERTLSLCSMFSAAQPLFLARPRALRVLLRPAPRTREGAVERTMELFQVLRGTRFPFDVARHRELAEQAYDRAPAVPGAVARQLAAILKSGSRVRALRGLRVPTLCLHGTEDPLIPVGAGRATARAIPGARLHLIEGMGHHLPPGAWEEIAGALAGHALGRVGETVAA